MANQAFDIRQLAGWLGVSAGVSGGMLVGERIRWDTNGNVSVPATSTAVVTVDSPAIPLLPAEALVLESVHGALQPTEVSGSLSLTALGALIVDSTGVTVGFIQVIGPSIPLTMPKTASAFVGFFLETPPPLRPSDLLRLAVAPSPGTASTSPYKVRVIAAIANASAGALSINLYVNGIARVLSGVTP